MGKNSESGVDNFLRIRTGTEEAREFAAQAVDVLNTIGRKMPHAQMMDALVFLIWTTARVEGIPLSRIVLALETYERLNSKSAVFDHNGC